jgi:hypothetical protein
MRLLVRGHDVICNSADMHHYCGFDSSNVWWLHGGVPPAACAVGVAVEDMMFAANLPPRAAWHACHHNLHRDWPNGGGSTATSRRWVGGWVSGWVGWGVSTCTNLAAAAADRLQLLSGVLHVAACSVLLGTATAWLVPHSSAAACMALLAGLCWVPTSVLMCCCND